MNYRNINGFTPLHLACQANKPECVKELLVCGADVNIPAGVSISNVTEHKLPGIVKEYLQDNHKKLFVEVRKNYLCDSAYSLLTRYNYFLEKM